jgi:ribosome-associated heat shock protein Hsp15
MPAQRGSEAKVGNNVGMNLEPVRIDKWLWAARLVKTRALAVDAIRGGRVKLNGVPAKPSKDVRPGDRIEFSAGVIRLEAVIRATAERRLPASDAQLLYIETEESRTERERRVAEMRMTRPQGVDRNARPTKRDRRQFDKLRGRDD